MFIDVPNGTIPFMRLQYKTLKTQIESYIRFLIDYEQILHYPSQDEINQAPTD